MKAKDVINDEGEDDSKFGANQLSVRKQVGIASRKFPVPSL